MSQAARLERFDHQVGGHGQGSEALHERILIAGNRIFKPLQSGDRGQRETQRYQEWFDEKNISSNKTINELGKFLPKFYGTDWHSLDSTSNKIEYLILENMTAKFSKPCVLDLKMGQQSFAPYASKQKQERESAKYPVMRDSGFRFVGMKIYNKEKDSFDDYDRDYGYNMKLNEFSKGFQIFLSSGLFATQDCARKIAMKKKILSQLNSILDWFNNQHLFRFYSSSLLLVYEGDVTSELADELEIKLIDFAHVVDIEEPDGLDDGYIHGLKHLIMLLNDINF